MDAPAPLVERDDELAAVEDALARASKGDGSVLAIRGTAGVGKTSLLKAAAERGRDLGFRALVATAGRLEIDFPFGVARQLFERELATSAPDARESLLAGPARLGARALAEHRDDRVVADPASGLVHGLYWMVANLAADRPLLLGIDDLQWCDPASVQFLVHVARRVADLPVLLIVATRPDEHPGDPRAAAVLDDLGPSTVLTPSPLTDTGVRAMLDAADARLPAEVVRRLQTETGGNPFLVNELARSLAGRADWADGPIPAPHGVARAIQGRVRAAGPGAEALVAAVAVLGDGCVLAEAAAVARLDPDGAAAAASALLQADVLAVDDGVRFAHPLVRTAVEDGLSAPAASSWHARAARVLTERGADDERVAVQLMRTTPSGDREAAARLADAGRHALGRGAPQAAVHFLQRALDEGPDPTHVAALQTDLGTALLVADRFDEAAAVLRRAQESSRNDAELLIRTTVLWMALTGIGSSAVPEGVELLESTIARLQDPESRMMLESEFVNVANLDPSRLAATWRRLEPYAALGGRTPAERRLLSMATVKAQYVVTETAEAVADTARRAYAGGLLIDENPLDPTKWIWAVAALILTDQLAEAETALQRGAASAAATGSSQTLLVVEDLRGLLWLRRGRPADTVSEARDALDRLDGAHRTPVTRALEIALVRWSLLAMTSRGELDDADRLLSERDLAGALPRGPRQLRLHYERGWLRLGQRRPREALDEVLQLAEFNRQHGIETMVEAPWRTVAARALAALHDTAAAVEMADEHLGHARTWGLPRDLGVALRTRGQIEPDAEQRVALLESALAMLRSAPAPLESAYAATALGAALRRVGRRSEARAVLDEALAGAVGCDALAVAARARDELRLVGGHERARAVSGADSLTPAERRIARLAAHGLSNRQIAQELFLSVRTAENTLRRVYQKLDITSRRELSTALADDLGG